MLAFGLFVLSSGAIRSTSTVPRTPLPTLRMSSSTFSFSDLKSPCFLSPNCPCEEERCVRCMAKEPNMFRAQRKMRLNRIPARSCSSRPSPPLRLQSAGGQARETSELGLRERGHAGMW